jgi:hypothetical protein
MNAQHWEGPPDSEHLAGICPNCNLPSTFESRGEIRLTATDAERWMHNPRAANMSSVRGVVYQCRACFNGCLAVEQIDPSGDEVTYEGIHWWPPPGAAKLDQSISADLSDAFREGMRCLGAAAPHAAAVMYRRTIEGIVRDKGSAKAIGQLENRDLPGALKIMANESDLDPTLAEWADEVRGLGNVGGHFDPLEEVSVEQAIDLSHLVRQILRYKYEEPARRQRLRESRSP